MTTKRRKRFTPYPKYREVKGSPAGNSAFVWVGRSGHIPGTFRTLLIGTKNADPKYRDIHMTLCQAEEYANAILMKVRACRQRNAEYRAVHARRTAQGGKS